MNEFGVGRSAVHRHLRLLREHEFVHVHDEEWPNHSYRLDDGFIRLLERESKRLKRLWKRRIGWRVDTDPLADIAPTSNRGRRGHGIDPDDPWFQLREI